MEEDDSNATSTSRYRSPSFRKEEVAALVDLIMKYKHFILTKSTTSSANHAKDVAWTKLCKEFNNQALEYERTVESLRNKWENLKRDMKRVLKKTVDVKMIENMDIINKVIKIMKEFDENEAVNGDESLHDDKADHQNLLQHEDAEQYDSSNDSDDKQHRNRSANFSPRECRILINLVKEQKDAIMYKGYDAKSMKLKKMAWEKVTELFNRQSKTKRSMKVLQCKFGNMKALAKEVCKKRYRKSFDSYEALDNENTKGHIKIEPIGDFSDSDDGRVFEETPNNVHKDNHHNETDDPLDTVLNCQVVMDDLTQPTSSDEAKLRMELLNFQFETAKLERQKLLEKIQQDTTERNARATETSLRLRAARLEVLAAERKYSDNDPALRYTEQELLAKRYLETHIRSPL